MPGSEALKFVHSGAAAGTNARASSIKSAQVRSSSWGSGSGILFIERHMDARLGPAHQEIAGAVGARPVFHTGNHQFSYVVYSRHSLDYGVKFGDGRLLAESPPRAVEASQRGVEETAKRVRNVPFDRASSIRIGDGDFGLDLN